MRNFITNKPAKIAAAAVTTVAVTLGAAALVQASSGPGHEDLCTDTAQASQLGYDVRIVPVGGQWQRGDGRDQLFIGTNGRDRIDGRGGDDVICGLGGNDELRGGRGDDSIFGGEGRDEIFGERGDDWLAGQQNNDTIRGGNGQDDLRGGGGNDDCNGGLGTDTILGC